MAAVSFRVRGRRCLRLVLAGALALLSAAGGSGTAPVRAQSPPASKPGGASRPTGPGAVEFWSDRKKVTNKWALQPDATWMS